MTKAWIILFIAGMLECCWAVGLKYTHGFTRLVPSVLTVLCIVLSMGLLAIALKTIPVGTGYAVWTGIGALGTAVVGILLFHESTDLIRIVSLALILSGIVGLKLSSGQN